ncbi:SDR family NAD(P)-dependent oxidoreductase [Candidatus Babeliales bacterium]|nr:SDR family NAD(P)-dependent oxidoreductase [Candidatus Babeliales bacterium]
MKILITGGAGFIGCNVVKHFAQQGHEVFVIDNLSRQTALINIDWMRENVLFNFVSLDITDREGLESYFKERSFDAVIHLAAQVAVTTSVQDPRHDFYVNALGTFNVLECVRLFTPQAVFINASTNKVYGKIDEQHLVEDEWRYYSSDLLYKGVSEEQPLEFFSPYGCSKGTADQYTMDYARIYGLKTVTVRQSCIYGPHQFGVEDQGWIAWFIIAHLQKKPITIYGNGKQVRDVLYVSDLVNFYELVIKHAEKVKGLAFNMGGGRDNALSLLQFFDVLKNIAGEKITYSFDDWRPGDQLVFLSDNTRAETLLGFKPQVSSNQGIAKIFEWLKKYYQVDGAHSSVAARGVLS